jgi:hypothetical protein
MSVVAVRLMDLDVAIEEEEHRLEDYNEAEDARFFIGFGENETHGDPIQIDTVVGSGIGTGTGSTSLPELVPNPDASGSNSNSKKRSKCWNDFDELTKIVNGKKLGMLLLASTVSKHLLLNLLLVLVICFVIIALLRKHMNALGKSNLCLSTMLTVLCNVGSTLLLLLGLNYVV